MAPGEHAAPAATGTFRAGRRAIDRARGWGDRALTAIDTPRASAIALAVAMVIASIVYLWLTRGTTFWIDELYFFAANKGFDPKYLLTAHNGQLIWFPRLLYATVFKLFGPDYLVIRLIVLTGDLLVSGLVYALARRHVGPALALAPAILLLFFGTAWGTVLPGTGIINVYCVAAGLGAMLALEHGGRFADPLAALLLLVSIGCWSPGIAFAVGAGVLILLQRRGWARLWVAAVPLALFGLWWVAKPGYVGPLYGTLSAKASNFLLIPNYAADSISSALPAITGLDYGFSSSPASTGPVPDYTWGPVLAVLAIFALLLALSRWRIAKWPWHWFSILVVFWAAAAIASGINRSPSTGRYVYVSAILILVLAAIVAGRYRRAPWAVALVLGGTVLALGANVEMLREASPFLRTYASAVRADLSAIEIARDNVPTNFVPTVGAISPPLLAPATNSTTYLAAVGRNGSFADTLPELRAAPEADREEADQILAEADGVSLKRTAPPNPGSCRRTSVSAGVPKPIPLPPGGAVLRSTRTPAKVSLRRFGFAFTAQVGGLEPDRYYSLAIPSDAAPDRWWAQVSPTRAGTLEACSP